MTDSHFRSDPTIVPAEIDRWNRCAFLLNWTWGVGNNTFIALLTLIPFFGLVRAKGGEETPTRPISSRRFLCIDHENISLGNDIA